MQWWFKVNLDKIFDINRSLTMKFAWFLGGLLLNTQSKYINISYITKHTVTSIVTSTTIVIYIGSNLQEIFLFISWTITQGSAILENSVHYTWANIIQNYLHLFDWHLHQNGHHSKTYVSVAYQFFFLNSYNNQSLRVTR